MDFSTGIVHSFTGTVEEMRQLCDMGLYIGINGCGLRTDEMLEMVRGGGRKRGQRVEMGGVRGSENDFVA